MIGRGYTSKGVAEALVLTPATISTYRKLICKKLEIHSTAGLVAFGLSLDFGSRWTESLQVNGAGGQSAVGEYLRESDALLEQPE